LTTTMNHTPRSMGRPLIADSEPPDDAPLFAPRIEISTVVTYRGRQFTIAAEGYTIAQFADLLDRKFGLPSTTPAASGAAPSCKYHGPMKESSKAPGTFFCPAKMGDNTFCKERAS
jgi:hypothetical protein